MSAGGMGPAGYECCQIYAKANCSDEQDEDATNTMIHISIINEVAVRLSKGGRVQLKIEVSFP